MPTVPCAQMRNSKVGGHRGCRRVTVRVRVLGLEAGFSEIASRVHHIKLHA